MANKHIEFDFFDQETDQSGSLKVAREKGIHIVNMLLEAARIDNPNTMVKSITPVSEDILRNIKPLIRRSQEAEKKPVEVKVVLKPNFYSQEGADLLDSQKGASILEEFLKHRAADQARQWDETVIRWIQEPELADKTRLPNDFFAKLTAERERQYLLDFQKAYGYEAAGRLFTPAQLAMIRVIDQIPCDCEACTLTELEKQGDLTNLANVVDETPKQKSVKNQVVDRFEHLRVNGVVDPDLAKAAAKEPNKLGNTTQVPLIIMFNAPPRAGKDTAADVICETFNNVARVNFKDSLYARSSKMLNLDLDFWTTVCQNGDLKDKPMGDFVILGDAMKKATPRELLIKVAESFIKPNFGNNVFAEDAAKDIRNQLMTTKNNIFVMPDCGFDYESDTIRKRFQGSNVKVIQIHRTGFNFDNDSRDWVAADEELKNATSVDIFKRMVAHRMTQIVLEHNEMYSTKGKKA